MKNIGAIIDEQGDWKEAATRARAMQARADQERRDATITDIKAQVSANLATNGVDIKPEQMTCIPATSNSWKIAFQIGKVTAVRSTHSYEESGYVANFEQYGWEPFYSDTGQRVVFFGDGLEQAIYVAHQADQ